MMKKRFWILLLCALAVCLPVGALAAVPQVDPAVATRLGNVVLSEHNGTLTYQVGSDSPQAYAGVFTFDGSDSATATAYTLTVANGAHTVRLLNAKLENEDPPIRVSEGAQLTLRWEGDVSISALHCAIRVPETADGLTLDNGSSTDKLSIGSIQQAAGNRNIPLALGIGNPQRKCGTVRMKSGVVEITDCRHAIGALDSDSEVEISGGTLTAQGGIGSSDVRGFATVRITGGTVRVNGVIGNAKNHAEITISGEADVTATATDSPAIGTGKADKPLTGPHDVMTTSVDITGGYVEATSTYTNNHMVAVGAAIGGPEHTSKVTVQISGNNTYVMAKASTKGSEAQDIPLRGINGNIRMTKMKVIYISDSIMHTLSGYNGENPVIVTFGGQNDIHTGSFLDDNGVPYTASVLSTGGDVQLAPLSSGKINEIKEKVSKTRSFTAIALAGIDLQVINASSDALKGMSFGLSAADIPASVGPPQFVIAHEMANGEIEQLPVLANTRGGVTSLRTATAPTGASPFVLLLMNPAVTPTPQTGDSAQPLWWLALTLLAGTALGAILLRQRRRAKSDG